MVVPASGVWRALGRGAVVFGLVAGGSFAGLGVPAARADSAVSATIPSTARATEAAPVGLPAAKATPKPVDLTIALTNGFTVHADADNDLTIAVTNNANTPTLAGTLTVSLDPNGLDDTAAMDSWLDGSAADAIRFAITQVAPVSPGQRLSVPVTVPASTLYRLRNAPVLGVRATFSAGTTSITVAQLLANASLAGSRTIPRIGFAAPVTVPPQTDEFLSATDLDTWTQPGGVLGRTLAEVRSLPVALGIDPRIIASIRALGKTAPRAATSWLDTLHALPNEQFPLAYADADLSGQIEANIPLARPTSLADALKADNFSDNNPGAGDGAQGPADPTPAPNPTHTKPTAPSTNDLIAWPYTRTDIAWPSDDTVDTGVITTLRAQDLPIPLLAPGNVTTPNASDRNAATKIENSTAVVSDARLTALIRDATDATSTDWAATVTRITAELAALTATQTTAPVLFVGFTRNGTLSDLRRLLTALEGTGLMLPASLGAVIGAPPVARMLVPQPESSDRLSTIATLGADLHTVHAVANVTTQPASVVGPYERRSLALLDTRWLDIDAATWTTATRQLHRDASALLGAVSVVPSSLINVVSQRSGVPITLQNTLAYPVTVWVGVAPSNGRLVVDHRAEITIEAKARATVVVPVAAGVGNGSVTLTVTPEDQAGNTVGTSASLGVNVQADWEGIGSIVFGVLLLTLLVVGVIRNVRRRRRVTSAAPPPGD